MRIKYLFFILLLGACQANSSSEDTRKQFQKISDLLYQNNSGEWLLPVSALKDSNLFIKLVQLPNKKTKTLKVVIDKDSFIKINDQYFKDNNHVYFYQKIGDWPRFSIIEDADPFTFEVLKLAMDSFSNFYAKDKNHFYVGDKKSVMDDLELLKIKRFEK